MTEETLPKRRGRPPKYSSSMTPAQRQKEYLQRLRDAGGIDFRIEMKDAAMVRLFNAVKKKLGLSSNKSAGEYIIGSYLKSLAKKNA